MKSIKNVFSILVILMAMIFTGMQSANAQKSVYISWDPDECDECTISGGFWRVALEVYDYCNGPATQVYVDVQYLNLSNNDATFQLTQFCNSQSQEACYFVVATLQKYCPNGLGGYTLSCFGKNPGVWHTCPYLMGSGQFGLTITFQ